MVATTRVLLGTDAARVIFNANSTDEIVMGHSSTQLVANLAKAIGPKLQGDDEIIITGEHEGMQCAGDANGALGSLRGTEVVESYESYDFGNVSTLTAPYTLYPLTQLAPLLFETCPDVFVFQPMSVPGRIWLRLVHHLSQYTLGPLRAPARPTLLQSPTPLLFQRSLL